MLVTAEGSFELIRLISGTNPPIAPTPPDSDAEHPLPAVRSTRSRRATYVTTAFITLLVLNQVISLAQRRETYIRALDAEDENSALPAMGLSDQAISDEIAATTLPGAVAWHSGIRALDLTGTVSAEAMSCSATQKPGAWFRSTGGTFTAICRR